MAKSIFGESVEVDQQLSQIGSRVTDDLPPTSPDPTPPPLPPDQSLPPKPLQPIDIELTVLEARAREKARLLDNTSDISTIIIPDSKNVDERKVVPQAEAPKTVANADPLAERPKTDSNVDLGAINRSVEDALNDPALKNSLKKMSEMLNNFVPVPDSPTGLQPVIPQESAKPSMQRPNAPEHPNPLLQKAPKPSGRGL